jgi:hypothetical protein
MVVVVVVVVAAVVVVVVVVAFCSFQGPSGKLRASCVDSTYFLYQI